MSFLEVLWRIITMWEIWLSLIIVGVGSVIIMVVTAYLATTPVLAVIAGAILMLLTVTLVIWVIENAS